MKILVIDVGGTYTKYAIATTEGGICEKSKIHTVKSTREEFVESLVELYEQARKKYEIEGIALSMPGMIDSETGYLHTGGLIECIGRMNIVQVLEEKCKIPVSVENDASCAAYAELWKGSLKECKNAAVIVCGSGIGGAVISNRKVIKGVNLQVGEFSYILNESSKEYKLENCLGLNTSVHRLTEIAEAKIEMHDSLDGEKIFEMANAGNSKAIESIREYLRNIAVLIHNLRLILELEKVSIGGGISVQPLLLQLLREELEKINSVFSTQFFTPEVVSCEFFNDANLIGALYVYQLRKKERLCSR